MSARISTSKATRPRYGARTLLALVSLLALFVALPGCGGCTSSSKKLSKAPTDAEKRAEELRKKKELEKERPDFEFLMMNTLPNPVDRVERAVKPGHWAEGTLEARANHFDYAGQLAVTPIDLQDMPFRLGTSRPALLPKGQKRDLGLLIFPPVDPSPRSFGAELQTTRGSGVYREDFSLTRMPAHQYYLVALTRTPEMYSYLRDLDTIRAPNLGVSAVPGYDWHYRPMIPLVKRRVPLPNSLASWTSIACVVWDDLDPGLLTELQRQALIDWLHWGGQLVISSPKTLALLKGSFLDPYLPATSSGAIELTAADLAPLTDAWADPQSTLKVGKEWVAENLQVRKHGRVLLESDKTPLVVDGSVGRGRIALTAFSLSQPALAAWTGFDNFLSGCLLLRPSRAFEFYNEEVVVRWHDRIPIDAPGRVTQLRLLARDGGVPLPQPVTKRADQDPDYQTNPLDPPYEPGMAGWTDFSPLADAARTSLRNAAGIKIPSPRFVVGALAAYLLILVPLNWALFRLIGRVEWAWVAAPIISLAGAILVVRAAQLDIGFVRASNELAIVELQPNYPRAHVTRYAALYSSLSTGYDARFEDEGAVAMPFSDATTLLRGQSRSTVMLRRDDVPILEDFRVASNSIGMLHAEHMLPMQGQFTLAENNGQMTIANGTGWKLEDARVVHNGRYCELGTLAPNDSLPIELTHRLPDDKQPAPSASEPDSAEVDVLPAMRIALSDAGPGEWRLVGWTSEQIPGMAVEPAAAQSRRRAVVVAHLRYGKLPEAERDHVTRGELEQKHGIEPRAFRPIDAE